MGAGVGDYEAHPPPRSIGTIDESVTDGLSAPPFLTMFCGANAKGEHGERDATEAQRRRHQGWKSPRILRRSGLRLALGGHSKVVRIEEASACLGPSACAPGGS